MRIEDGINYLKEASIKVRGIKLPPSLTILWFSATCLGGGAAYNLSSSLYNMDGLLTQEGTTTLLGYIVPAVSLVVGRLADTISTSRTLETMLQANTLGIAHKLRELNPNLPSQPTPRDLFTKKNLFVQCGAMIFGITFPPSGISISVFSIVAAANNELLGSRLRIDIAVKTGIINQEGGKIPFIS